MTTRSEYMLWADAVVLAVLIVFVCNLALALPVRPGAEYWGLAWPPFVGDADIRVPDNAVYASFFATLVTAGILVAYAVAAAVFKIKAIFVQKKGKETLI